MSNAYDMRGDRRKFVPKGQRNDPFYSGSSAMEREAEKFRKFQRAIMEDGPVTDPRVQPYADSINWYAARDETDSPIEYHLLMAMAVGHSMKSKGFQPIVLNAGSLPYRDVSCIQIIPQFKVAIFRMDFALVQYNGTLLHRICVECDGHEFHEKTPEQAAHDKRKDRELMMAGWPVLRFTGSEIAAGGESCADDVRRALNGLSHANISAFEHGRKAERDKDHA